MLPGQGMDALVSSGTTARHGYTEKSVTADIHVSLNG